MMIKYAVDDAKISENNCILQVKTLFPDGKTAKISCDMRNQKEYSYFFVFDVTEDEYNSGMRLEALVHSDKVPDIVNCGMPHDHTVALSRTGIRCLHYLARYDAAAKSYFLLDQEQNNVSELLKILPTLRCQVRYEPIRTGFLGLSSSSVQTAILSVSGDKPMQGTSVSYRCRGAGRDRVLYGIDLNTFWNREMRITIGKNEKVEFQQPADDTYLLQM